MEKSYLDCLLEKDVDGVEAHLQSGADPNRAETENNFAIPLRYATTTPGMFELLLKRGANVNHALRGDHIVAFEFAEICCVGFNQNEKVFELAMYFGANYIPNKFCENDFMSPIFYETKKKYENWPTVPTLRTLCLRVIFKEKVDHRDCPQSLLEFPDEFEENELYLKVIETLNKNTKVN